MTKKWQMEASNPVLLTTAVGHLASWLHSCWCWHFWCRNVKAKRGNSLAGVAWHYPCELVHSFSRFFLILPTCQALCWVLRTVPVTPPSKNMVPRVTGLPRGCSGKESTCQCRRHKRRGLDTWVGKIPWKRKWQPALVFLLGKSHGQRSLAGHSLWGHKESDMTKHAHTHAHRVIRCVHSLFMGTVYTLQYPILSRHSIIFEK